MNVDNNRAAAISAVTYTSIALFVKMQPGVALTPEVVKALKAHIRTALTPRHVPAAIVAVDDVPYTRSGKKVDESLSRFRKR